VPQGLSALLALATARLTEAGVASPHADAWSLASAVLDRGRGDLQAAMVIRDVEVADELTDRFQQMLERRVNREPLWHITGFAPFLDMDLEVGPGVFVPRPETELVAHSAIAEAQLIHPAEAMMRIVDLCSGSGALAIALARGLPHADVLAIEISADALPFLERNTHRLASDQVTVVHADIEHALTHPWRGTVDLVVSNPPYLLPGEQLDVETEEYDPALALFGGEDGLDVIRRVVPLAAEVLRPGGVLVMEHGVAQGEAIRGLLEESGFTSTTTECDLVGRDRFSRGSKR
jgi:release factor glutamine methyltransferase